MYFGVHCAENLVAYQDVTKLAAHLSYNESGQMCSCLFNALIFKCLKTVVHTEVN